MDRKTCYFRKKQIYGYGSWFPASIHHQRALELYIEIQSNYAMKQNDPVTICTTKYDGSTFMANFSKESEGIYLFQEQGSEDCYEIMFCSISLPCSISSK